MLLYKISLLLFLLSKTIGLTNNQVKIITLMQNMHKCINKTLIVRSVVEIWYKADNDTSE